MTPVVFEPEASADLNDAYSWYEDKVPGLGERLKSDVSECLTIISEFPQAFPEWRYGVRRAGLSVFPYLVYYLVLPEAVRVVAILHGATDPNRAEDRI